MKILALPRYTPLGASSRVRFYQYLPWLEQEDLRVITRPLFGDAYVRVLQQRGRRGTLIWQAYLSRLARWREVKDFDLLWIEKELFPWIPAGFEQSLLRSGVPYVLDYDDAVFHQYDEHNNDLVRYLLADKHPRLMRGAALVVAGNTYLANFARNAGAQHVEILPSVVDLQKYSKTRKDAGMSNRRACIVGWVGQTSTAAFLAPHAELFRTLERTTHMRFVALGIDTTALGLPMTSLQWTEETEASDIAEFDIGIMPLPNQSFERGKCGYKLIQYMACGLPVIASPVGVNREIVEHGVNGFLADTPTEWKEALLRLASDPQLRWQMGIAGRRKVENAYCLQETGPRLYALLNETRATGNPNTHSQVNICAE